MMNDITNSDDVIDSRDILDYIEKYEDDADFKDEVKALQSIVKQYCDNYTDGLKDLEFGVFLLEIVILKIICGISF